MLRHGGQEILKAHFVLLCICAGVMHRLLTIEQMGWITPPAKRVVDYYGQQNAYNRTEQHRKQYELIAQ